MKRMLLAAGAASVTAMLMSGAASANPIYRQSVAPPAASPPVSAASPMGWHYEWQYHYGKWGRYVPGWVPVLNTVR